MIELKEKVAIVTGGGTGIGRACALVLAAQGARVAVNYSRSRDDAEQTAKDCRAAGGDGLAIQADVSQKSQIDQLVQETLSKWSRLDILITRAGTTKFPDLRIVLAHMAHPWQTDCIAVIRKHPNVWADISALHYREWSYYTCLRLATEWSVLHKLLFGSDYPVATPRETAEALPHVNDMLEGTKLPRVPVDELMKIVERDSLEVLGLA